MGGVDFETIKKQFDAYGVGVRAGTITPQENDEVTAREALRLVEMSEAVRSAWKEDEGVRRPITLKMKGEDAPITTENTESD